MAKYRTNYRYKADYLVGRGLLPDEYKEIAKNYTMEQIRTLPYIQALLSSRSLTVNNLRRSGLSNNQIRKRIVDFYEHKGYKSIWDIIKSYRKESIVSGKYTPLVKKGSHHPKHGERGYTNYKEKSKEQKRKLNKAKVSASRMGDIRAWIKELEENKKKALDKGDTATAKQIDKQISNLRKSKR